MGLFSWRKTKKQQDGDSTEEMSFLDHLEELRWHIFRSVVVIVLFGIVLFSFRQEVIGGIFMSPFKRDFITYQFLCQEFGQFCDSEVEVEELKITSPDSLDLKGYVTEMVEIPQWTIDTTVTDTSTGAIRLDSLPAPPLLKTQRRKISLRVGLDELMTNGQINGFSLETEDGNFVRFQAISPYEQFMKALFYAFFGGLIFAFPYVSWELWNFIKPALNPKEARSIRWNVVTSSALFFFGITFGYFIILPFSINFLSNFVLFEEAANIWRIGDVVNFVLLLLFGTGFLFQLPVVVFYLSKIGLATPKGLRKYRKHAVVGLLVVAAIVTPPDPMSQVLIFFPLMALYEVGIFISRRVEKKRVRREEEERMKDEEYRRNKMEELRKEAEQKKAREQNAKDQEKATDADPEEGDDDDDLDLSPPDQTIPRG